MKRYVLDTNIVSSIIRQRSASPAFKRASDLRNVVCTSIVVAAEIRFGMAKKQSPSLEREVRRVLDGLVILAFEPPADEFYAKIRFDLERRGCPIGGNDLLIAAQCLALDATLVTNNTREFERVRDLRIEDWLTL